MHDSNGSLMPEGPARVPKDSKNLHAELEALAEFIRDLKQHADRSLGPLESGRSERDQTERNRAEEDRQSMREAFDRWKKSNEEYDRRWDEMQRDIQRRLKALEGRSSDGSGKEEKPEEEGTTDG